MPLLDALNREHFHFAIIFLCVPLQYFIVQYMGSTENNRTYAIDKMIQEIKSFPSWLSEIKSSVFEAIIRSLNKLQKFTGIKYKFYEYNLKNKYGHWMPDDLDDEDDDLGESTAFEVLKYREKDGYFARSAEIRETRSPEIKYRVGQVIKHKKWGYRGVIVGWDERARAPENWIATMHGPSNPHWRTQPNYCILVDTRDRATPQFTYVPQENLQIIQQTKIIHPAVDEYFENFDGTQYLPRPWLKGIYPRD